MNAESERLPEITFTEAARAKLSDVLASHGDEAAGLRLEVYGRQFGEFQHILSLVQKGKEPLDDVEVEADGFRVFVERINAPYLNGVEIHYEERGGESGLVFNNPNPLWFGEPESTIQRIFDEHINPAIASHGGFVTLLAVRETTAFVRLGGGCQGCGMVSVTLKQGIEATLKESVPGIERVVDETDHDSGENPYYKPSKK